MEIQSIKISESERKIVSGFMGEEYPLEIDFNWLMPVVEKIGEGLADSDNAGYIETYSELAWGWEVKIFWEDIFPIVRVHSKDSFKDAYWQAVIKFIQWYNQNKTP